MTTTPAPDAQGLRQRPGDQPLPTPTSGPGMHDLLIADLRAKGTEIERWDRVATDLAARRDLGLTRYGSLLQVGNGRDALRDLYEEALDALA